MAVQKISIEHFLSLAKEHPVIDVRSPAEFLHAHIPSAYNLPLFSDEERKIVGTIYKQQSRENAIKSGLGFFGVKMGNMVEKAEEIVAGYLQPPMANKDSPTPKTLLIHCWRGGMRSAAVAWLLDIYGYKVYTLEGGYKVFRNHVLKQFEKPYHLKILGGYTGSGKTELIKELLAASQAVINLEALANHKGSAFGDIGEKPQPSQEMFENLLALELLSRDSACIWLEDESRRIGTLNIPAIFWDKMRNSPVFFLDIPFEERLRYLVSIYGTFSKERLAGAITRIQKRLGGAEMKNALNLLQENNIPECFAILLSYYDKCYDKSLHKTVSLPRIFHKLYLETVSINNVELLLYFSEIKEKSFQHITE